MFRALADPGRRRLLDSLYVADGQTLGELCEVLPEMTRYGVMNHLRVLEQADLVVVRKVGRSKHHYLNPVPIRQMHDRWIGKYTEPWVGALASLADRREGGETMSRPVHVYRAYIRSTPEEVWRALVDGEVTPSYYYGTRVESAWKVGEPIAYRYPDGTVAADGTVLAVDPPRRLEMTFHAHWSAEVEAGGPVRMVWSIEDGDGAVRLTVELWDVDPESRTYGEFSEGLPYIVSGLKTVLETGAALTRSG